jgi:polynucleotide 5'-hydroxyl-kinase GRC3/NOL9
MDIPPSWKALNVRELDGTLMIIGAPDVGKSTFARYLFQRLYSVFTRIAFLDGDPGQGTFGPPATMTLTVTGGKERFDPSQTRHVFVGALSPSRHMLPVLTGAARLAEAARRAQVSSLIYDTSGLVGTSGGGHILKLSQIDLLHPKVLFALQRHEELEPLLAPLRRTRRVRIVELPLSSAVRQHDRTYRRERRNVNFQRFFSRASLLKLQWSRFAVLPRPRFERHQLVGFEDDQGFLVTLGIVQKVLPATREIEVLTPLESLQAVDIIRLGDVLVDPETFRNMPLTRGH